MTGDRPGSQAPDPGDAPQLSIHAPLGAVRPTRGEEACGPGIPKGNRPGADRSASFPAARGIVLGRTGMPGQKAQSPQGDRGII